MSLADKQILLNRIAHDLGDDLTSNQLTAVMSKFAEGISEFDVSYLGEQADLQTEFLTAFLSAKTIEGKSAKTVERYRYIITRMIRKVGVPVEKINVYHLRAYLAERQSSGISESTLRGERDIFCSFFGWLSREGLLEKNPAGNLTAVKVPKIVRYPFSPVELERLKEACTCERDKALILFLNSSGCRVNEVCTLNRADIDFGGRSCCVLGKGNKERIVFLDDLCLDQLSRYLGSRTDESPALFVGRGSDRLTPGGVRFMLCRLGERSGVEHVHPHRFRRTLATGLIDRGMAIQEVASILGHEKLDTTMKYVHITTDRVHASYNKYI